MATRANLSALSARLVSNIFAAEGEARIYLTLSDSSSAQEKTISAFIKNAPLIYGADIRLTFDPAVLYGGGCR
jgi:hypothetical protein